MNKIHQIYSLLYKSFGKQGWWPTTLENELHPKHHGKAPKNDKERFEIIIGAILTQNTNWKNVEKAIFNLNKNQLLDINKIKKINKKRLASLIKPSGYFNQKAERLKIIADFYSKNKNPSRGELLDVKGIGPETADSILLYALGKTSFVVDAYTKRIFSRLGLCNGNCSYDELQQMFHKNLPKEQKLFNQYHALLVELGKNYCKTKPICKDCPLKRLCSYKKI
ncbi:endonuclease [Candidatus Woesearchaeota archaeon]|nr:endonuclease [Candidatus Woesearchaeota archaeon]